MAQDKLPLVVIGGGAAGYFAAIRAAELASGRTVILLEATRKVLTKVHLSGGGRCNVTHHCFDPTKLLEHYPRGAKELRAPFLRFQPRDTVAWFQGRGVELKAEADGRMFPVTDSSATIASCLERSAEAAGVTVRLGASVTSLASLPTGGFLLTLKDGSALNAERVLLATGSAPAGLQLASALGHKIAPHAPSLFTFNIKDERLSGLAGVAFSEVGLTLSCPGSRQLTRVGPLLITHWGLSGPAVLKLSAFGALALSACSYQADLNINFLVEMAPPLAAAQLRAYKDQHARRSVAKNSPFPNLPRRFWETLAVSCGADEATTYATLSRGVMDRLLEELTFGLYKITGKGVFKEEFVSAGGVCLKEVDFRSMESRLCPGLHFAGEALAVDGITGGFNFQAAWTTAWIAAEAMTGQAKD